MDYARKERIGKPGLFTGREAELTYFLGWLDGIKDEKSQSTAILARRKMGKTAIMERLFNILFYKNDGVIPFYYEIKEKTMWIGDFCKEFFISFIYQYLAFKTRKTAYLFLVENDFEKVKQDVLETGLDYLVRLIQSVEYAYRNEQIDALWESVRQAPHAIASSQNEFIVQMIDEFQFLNDMFYRDKALEILQDDVADGYLNTAESKVAPLLISGRRELWTTDFLKVVWLARFRWQPLEECA